MDFNIDEIQKKLNKYNQSHLLNFLSEQIMKKNNC